MEQLEKNLISVSSTDHLKRYGWHVLIATSFVRFFLFFFSKGPRNSSITSWRGRASDTSKVTFVRIILGSGLSEIFCLQNLWVGLPTILIISKVTCLIFISFLVFWKFSFIRGEKPSVWNAFKQRPVIQSATHGTGNTWWLCASIKSGENSGTTYMISIVAFHILETQIVLNICD